MNSVVNVMSSARQQPLLRFFKRSEVSLPTATSSTASSPVSDQKNEPDPKRPKISESDEQPGTSFSGVSVEQTKGTQSGKPKRVKKFQNYWLSEYNWLSYENNKMYCNVCIKASNVRKSLQTNVFVMGCSNMQHSSLSRHQSSDDHLLARSVTRQQQYMVAAKECVNKHYMPILEAQMKTAMFLAQENLPNRKFLRLIDLQLENGASVFSDRKGIVTNHQAASTFQKYASDVLRENAIVRIKNSPFVGIMLDESLDIAVNKKLVFFCKILHNNDVKIEFVANISITDGKAETVYNCILQFLNDNGIDVTKVSGLGSDGASVMMGKVSGVGVRMKSLNPKIVHIWCAAHRVTLVSFWAAKPIPYLQTVNATLIQVYTFYQYSAPRYQKLRELQQVLGTKVRRFKKTTNVRWLSLSEAVSALYSAYSALVLSLEHEQASNPGSEGAAKAKGILTKIKTFKFIVTLAFLKDILEILERVLKLFQRDNINIHTLNSTIASTKMTLEAFSLADPATVEDVIDQVEEKGKYQGIQMSVNLFQRRQFVRLKRAFIQNLISEFEKRFPDDSLGILKDLNVVLNPKLLPAGNLQDYGIENLERCIQYFSEEPPLIQARDIRQSFLQFKYVINVNRDMDVQEFSLLVISEYKAAFPNFAVLAEILCTCPLTSVPCERGFSLQNRHHNASSCRRTVANVEHRMFIEFSSKSSDYSVADVARKAVEKYMHVQEN